MNEIKVYTLTEVIDILKVTRKTLYAYIKSGKIKAIKIGRNWRITDESLREFLQHGTE